MSEPIGTLDPTKGCLVSWGGGGSVTLKIIKERNKKIGPRFEMVARHQDRLVN
jgi:hypothetical protein